MSSATPLAILGGVWAFTAVLRGFSGKGSGSCANLFAFATLLGFSPFAWAAIPVPAEDTATARATDEAALCREEGTLAPLRRLGTGVVFAPIDAGSHLLAATDLSVLGAPYHRNNHGNRLVINGFSADPDQAQPIVTGSGARFVALCPGQVQAEALRARNPHGLAAALLSDHVPEWLDRVPIEETRYKVFAIR